MLIPTTMAMIAPRNSTLVMTVPRPKLIGAGLSPDWIMPSI